ncbi:MAG: hypothetical protein IJH31_02505 [Erysipelotrichaceae bacterium]|nr:hypothetical protein [Erysipelotrichaceae bacterium]
MKKYELKPTDDNILITLEKDLLNRNKDLFSFIKLIQSPISSEMITLDGKWGCGKTFFVKQLMMSLNSFNRYSNYEQDIRDRVKKVYKDKIEEVISKIKSALGSGMSLRTKIKLIENFIENLQGDDVRGSWESYIDKQIIEDLDQIIYDENLNKDETYKFIEDALRTSRFDSAGTALNKILPPISRFDSDDRENKKNIVIGKLTDFFNRYWDIGIDFVQAILMNNLDNYS